jgi:dihydroneopterin aldolase/2-amino-4-hydroxy-6-hydroxymethyldihydropteridine diphosphokinase
MMQDPPTPRPPQKDTIGLTGLRVRGYHGVFGSEREQGQDFVVDVVLELDLSAAAASDSLELTVHYGELADRLVAIVAGEPVNLIETLAARLSNACLAHPRVEAATVTVHKPSAPIPHRFSDVSVTLRRSRAQAVTRAVLSIGSNLGDRLANLRGAVEGLGDTVRGLSHVYETPPWGDPDQPAYLNAALLVEAPVPERTWLARAAELERVAGRVRDPARRYGPRPLDVDVIAVWTADGSPVHADDPEWMVPHPRAHVRAFVLVPWLDLDPDADLPGHGRVADLLRGPEVAADLPGVVRRADLSLSADV